MMVVKFNSLTYMMDKIPCDENTSIVFEIEFKTDPCNGAVSMIYKLVGFDNGNPDTQWFRGGWKHFYKFKSIEQATKYVREMLDEMMYKGKEPNLNNPEIWEEIY